MIDPTAAWLNALAFMAGYGAAELQHRMRKHLRSMGPPKGSYGISIEDAERTIETSARCRRAAELYAKLIDPSMGTPWEKDRTFRIEPDPPEYFVPSDKPISIDRSFRLDEGLVQRGNGSGGPTTQKPDIIPRHQTPEGWIHGPTNPPPEKP